ncbi:unnamed protein product [Ranitomeya imitator]|uniref:SGNH hydrolase-type esterase domain-containing protein n=1 Tax=Ranitomeya imitator TaxID=111125 RepID=A0ABN9M0T9_9NEOB|nr:unnamed protein product [Ranitomeya imitator]
MRGMMWSQVLPEVVHIARVASSPTIVVIHAGGNDLASSPLAELLTLIRSDMDKFPSFIFFPIDASGLVRSYPKAGVAGGQGVECHGEIQTHVESEDIAFFVRHHRLEGDNSGFLLPDGVHLNEAGIDIFLNGIREGVVQAVHALGGVVAL